MRSILPILAVLIISFIPFIYAQNSQPITSCNIIAIINFDPEEKHTLVEVICPPSYEELTLLIRSMGNTNSVNSEIISIKNKDVKKILINNRDINQLKPFIKRKGVVLQK